MLVSPVRPECDPGAPSTEHPLDLNALHPPMPEGVLVDSWLAEVLDSKNFTSPDLVLPDVPTIQFQGTVKLGRIPVEWTFDTREQGLDRPERIFPFFSGFGGIKVSSKPFSRAMAKLDMGTLTLEPIREDDRSCRERLFDPHAIQIEAMEAALEGLAYETGIALSSELGGTKAVPIGHSMGGESTVGYAEDHIETTELALLIATIGFGSPNVMSMLKKFIHVRNIKGAITEEMVPFILHPELQKDTAAVKKALGYFILNPLRTIGEVGSCLSSDLKDRSKALHDEGVDVIYGQPYYDILVQGLEGARTSVTMVSEIERAGHMLIQAKPGRAAYWVRGAVTASGLARAA